MLLSVGLRRCPWTGEDFASDFDDVEDAGSRHSEEDSAEELLRRLRAPARESVR